MSYFNHRFIMPNVNNTIRGKRGHTAMLALVQGIKPSEYQRNAVPAATTPSMAMRLPALLPGPPKLRDEALVVLDPSPVLFEEEEEEELVDVAPVEDAVALPEPAVVVVPLL